MTDPPSSSSPLESKKRKKKEDDDSSDKIEVIEEGDDDEELRASQEPRDDDKSSSISIEFDPDEEKRLIKEDREAEPSPRTKEFIVPDHQSEPEEEDEVMLYDEEEEQQQQELPPTLPYSAPSSGPKPSSPHPPLAPVFKIPAKPQASKKPASSKPAPAPAPTLSKATAKNQARIERRKKDKDELVIKSLKDLPVNFGDSHLYQLLENIPPNMRTNTKRINIIHAYLTSITQDRNLIVGMITQNQDEKISLIDSWEKYEEIIECNEKLIKIMMEEHPSLVKAAFISPECHTGEKDKKQAKKNQEEEGDQPEKSIVVTNEDKPLPPKVPPSKKRAAKRDAKQNKTTANVEPAKDALEDKLVEHRDDVEKRAKKLRNKLHVHTYILFNGNTLEHIDSKWFKRACIEAGLFVDIHIQNSKGREQDDLNLLKYMMKELDDPKTDAALLATHKGHYPLYEAQYQHIHYLENPKNEPELKEELYVFRCAVLRHMDLRFFETPDLVDTLGEKGTIEAVKRAAGRMMMPLRIQDPETRFMAAVTTYMLSQRHLISCFYQGSHTYSCIFSPPSITITTANGERRLWTPESTVYPTWQAQQYVHQILARVHKAGRLEGLNTCESRLINRLDKGNGQFPEVITMRDWIELLDGKYYHIPRHELYNRRPEPLDPSWNNNNRDSKIPSCLAAVPVQPEHLQWPVKYLRALDRAFPLTDWERRQGLWISMPALQLAAFQSLLYLVPHRKQRVVCLHGRRDTGKSSFHKHLYGLYQPWYIGHYFSGAGKPGADLTPNKLVFILDDIRITNSHAFELFLKTMEQGDGVMEDAKFKNISPTTVHVPQIITTQYMFDIVTMRGLNRKEKSQTTTKTQFKNGKEEVVGKVLFVSHKDEVTKKRIEQAERDQDALQNARTFGVGFEHIISHSERDQYWDDYFKDPIHAFEVLYFSQFIRRILTLNSPEHTSIFDLHYNARIQIALNVLLPQIDLENWSSLEEKQKHMRLWDRVAIEFLLLLRMKKLSHRQLYRQLIEKRNLLERQLNDNEIREEHNKEVRQALENICAREFNGNASDEYWNRAKKIYMEEHNVNRTLLDHHNTESLDAEIKALVIRLLRIEPDLKFFEFPTEILDQICDKWLDGDESDDE